MEPVVKIRKMSKIADRLGQTANRMKNMSDLSTCQSTPDIPQPLKETQSVPVFASYQEDKKNNYYLDAHLSPEKSVREFLTQRRRESVERAEEYGVKPWAKKNQNEMSNERRQNASDNRLLSSKQSDRLSKLPIRNQSKKTLDTYHHIGN